MNTKIVILAAGKGKRMNNPSGLPKVLSLVKGQPLIHHLLNRIKQSQLDPCPILVVGHGADWIRQACGPAYTYVEQTELLGTGHAVKQAMPALPKDADAVMVLYGDHPFTDSLMLKALHLLHQATEADISLLTATVSDFSDWQKPFYDFGRIVRDQQSNIIRIVEKKDANEQELAIREINPGMYCFKKTWLEKNINSLSNQNVQGEYYLTDLVHLAVKEGAKLASLATNPLHVLGINTPEHLALAEKLVN